MNEIIKADGPAVTMTSLELVEFINAYEGRSDLTHANFMAKVPKVLGEGGVIQFQDTYLHPQNGQTYPCYRFPKREACLMAMSYSYELQAKVFDRMTALEAKPASTAINLRDPKQLAAAALQLIEVNQELQATIDTQQQQIAQQTPKVQAFDRIATSDGSLCITDAAKTLQMQPRKFTQLLQEHRFCYRRPMGSGWLAYQDKIQAGLMEHKVITGEKSDGSEWTNTQCRITAKGLTKLAEVVRQAELH